MKDEYIIINKNQILKRIEELEKQIKILTAKDAYGDIGKLSAYKQILSQSTPLEPILEKAYHDGCFTYCKEKCEWTNGDEVNYALEAIGKLKI